MQRFTELYIQLDQTNSTNEKVAAMVDYFKAAPPADAAWAIFFLSGNRLKRLIKRQSLKEWVLQETGYQEWLLDETYQSVGDLAETIALLLPEPSTQSLDEATLTEWVTQRIQPLTKMSEAEREQRVKAWWCSLDHSARFVLNKLLTGAFRVGVSQRLVIRALAQVSHLDTAVIAHRLMGHWQPDEYLLAKLFNPDITEVDASTPYPFYLASPLLLDVNKTDAEVVDCNTQTNDQDMASSNTTAAALELELGSVKAWGIEWKWDGIRAQLIKRDDQIFIWSRGEELLEGRFPEIEHVAMRLENGTVLDGEILVWDAGEPQPFAQLQRRIGRLKPGPKLLKEAPVSFLAYDCLELQGKDQREFPYSQRRVQLERAMAQLDEQQATVLLPSECIVADQWSDLVRLHQESRARGVEGFILKRLNSAYQVGRKRGDWWKWKVEPYTIDAVLLYAQPGSGRRSNLFTDYTFAVWSGEPNTSELVPVAKAYSGLNDDEILKLDKWIRKHTKERFGPVRSVQPQHVFELAFEGIQESKRHKSGVAFRFPRIARWRQDLTIKDADTLNQVKELLTEGSQAKAVDE